MGVTAGLISMFCWGTAIFLAAFSARKIGNILTLFWMQLFGSLVALFYFLFTFAEYDLFSISGHILVLMVIAGLQMMAYLAFYKGLEKGEVTLVSPIGAAWGLIVVVLGIVFFKETLSGLQSIAIFLIIIGIVLLSINLSSLFRSGKFYLAVGVKEGLIAMLGWGVSLFLLAIPSKELGWFLPTLVFRTILVTYLAIYISVSLKKFIPRSGNFPLLLLLGIGLFDIAGFFAFSFGVSGANASIVAPIASAFALVTVLLAFIFLREKISMQKLVGISAIVSGLVLISV